MKRFSEVQSMVAQMAPMSKAAEFLLYLRGNGGIRKSVCPFRGR